MPINDIDLTYLLNLPPQKAIEYFKSKGYVITWNWTDVWESAHAKAFTVAKVIRMDILQDIRKMIEKALEDGITLQEFRKELEPKLRTKGWWGYKFVSYPDGRVEKILEGSPWRLKTIYRTNMQTAYMAGRYKEQIENVDDRPYWQYIAVLDSKTRPAHRLLNGKVFRYDDPFWNTHYPPLGFNCRCRVRALSKEDIQKKNINIEKSNGNINYENVLISKKTGEVAQTAIYKDPVTGNKIPTDPGWSYNPGKSAWFPDLDNYPYDIAKKWIEGGLTGPDFKAFFEGKIKGNFPVAVLEEEYRKAIKSKTQVVYLSDGTLEKNKTNHPEISLNIYQQLPSIITNAQLIVQDSRNTFVFLKIGKEIYYGAIKATQTGETNFLTSLRLAKKSDINKIKNKGKVLKDVLDL